MERIKGLNRYQKGILILLAAMAIIFGAVYSAVTSRTGYLYMDTILEVTEENGNTVYSGKIRGQDCCFVITRDRSVTFQAGESVFGPYTLKEDPTAVPENHSMGEVLRGIELTEVNTVRFRGGIVDLGSPVDFWYLVNEDGTDAGMTITVTMGDGTVLDGDGNVVHPMEPSVSTILDIMHGPELTHKGDWQIWCYALIISAITAVSILFADELFRLNLVFRIRDADRAEPSEWEIMGRYISWTMLAVIAFAVYLIGLQ